MVHQIQTAITKYLKTIQKIMEIGATIQGSKDFIASSIVDASRQENWVQLKEPCDISKDLTPRVTKQQSEEWHALRSTVPLSGSMLFKGLGFETLKEQQAHYDKVMTEKESNEFVSEEVAARMRHGTENEPKAIAALVGQILPFFYPNFAYQEEGCLPVTRGDKALIMVSPDGSLVVRHKSFEENPRVPVIALEFKFPVPAVYKTPVHYELPVRYIFQILSKMVHVSLEVEELLYLTWSSGSAAVLCILARVRQMENALESTL